MLLVVLLLIDWVAATPTELECNNTGGHFENDACYHALLSFTASLKDNVCDNFGGNMGQGQLITKMNRTLIHNLTQHLNKKLQQTDTLLGAVRVYNKIYGEHSNSDHFYTVVMTSGKKYLALLAPMASTDLSQPVWGNESASYTVSRDGVEWSDYSYNQVHGARSEYVDTYGPAICEYRGDPCSSNPCSLPNNICVPDPTLTSYSCHPNTCPSLPALPLSTSTNNSVPFITQEGTQHVTYGCADDYDFAFPQNRSLYRHTINCTGSGMWETPLECHPTCEKVSLNASLVVAAYSQPTARWNHYLNGTVVNFTCADPNMAFVGNKILTCVSDATGLAANWDLLPPTCVVVIHYPIHYHPSQLVRDLVEEQYDPCKTDLNGEARGSSCFYSPATPIDNERAQCAAFASNNTDRLAHIYTDEMFANVSSALDATKKYWLGLVNNPIANTTHWAPRDDDNGPEEPGFDQQARPPLPGIHSSAPQVGVCSSLEKYGGWKVNVNQPCAPGTGTKCLVEKRVPGQRYKLQPETRYDPNAPRLLDFATNDERRCSFECMVANGCLSFNLKPDTYECQLLPVKHDTAADNGTLVVGATGWGYYARIDTEWNGVE